MPWNPRAARAENLDWLSQHAFVVASSLPLSKADRQLRPTIEIARRLAALNAYFLFIAAEPDSLTTDRLMRFIRSSLLESDFTDEELSVIRMDRAEASEQLMDSCGWAAENAIALSWALGECNILPCDGTLLEDGTIAFLVSAPRIEPGGFDRWLAGLTPRTLEEVATMEDRFYCCHNAVRTAQFDLMEAGDDPPDVYETVPDGFHPIGNGGVIHERRHALTWALSPGVSWDDTDLST